MIKVRAGSTMHTARLSVRYKGHFRRSSIQETVSKGLFQHIAELLYIPHNLFRIEPEEDLDVDVAAGPARADAIKFLVLVE
jgi:hypothetical protein